MKDKYLILVKTLMDSSGWVTANNLASILDVSSRSVKNYISEINQLYQDPIISSREGYRIDLEKAGKILDENKDNLPQSSQDRVDFIINSLVKENDSVDAFDLCDELYISMSTLKNELKKVKRKVAKFDLKLINNNDQLSLEGIEKNKRKLMSSILYDESSVNFVNLKTVQSAFADIDIEYIKNVVMETFEEYHYFVNDYSLTNLVLHITIAIDRIKHNYTSFVSEGEKPMVKLHEFELAKNVVDRLEKHFDIEYNEGELYELTLLLISHANATDYNNVKEANLENLVGKECMTLVNELVNEVNSYYYINLSEPEFLTRFALHIRNLLVRSKYNYSSKNPLSNGIQQSCPLIYDAALNLAHSIEQRTGLYINDDEIAYIAFHIGSALETQQALHSKINAVLYCPNYYDMNKKLISTINTNFSSSILVKNVITDETEFENLSNYDLIISTIPISSVLPIPTITVSFLLNDKDIYAIRNKIDEIKIEKKKQMLKKHLHLLTWPDLFEKNSTLETQDETIHYMCSKLVKLDCVDESFEQEIRDRESMATTAFNSFAVPHALKMNANKTSMNIMISDKGIDWDGQLVNLVLMLAFNKNERYIFNEIFDTLTMILTDNDNIKRIITARDYEEFIELLVSFVREP
ncbi:lichenan operon transcriptional antiterminator [Breznakia sp. PF5-3]|uniref:BglG family transcription antiterminator n=1 Tax=unclassified Breznakia TaxID=2623764 RepID=UPI002404A999|nr:MULTISPECIES: BglG family transcription antiterminator [unclassified Breznakia]MDF9824281.1 lichenan operon transcriptional antiterminator [Breznakia sp. PM6-1]MDF9835505.1 lichenan operon transcriptional antiterminator [Breznakia sp. PF5-3]MDF9838021.1 lichenan operon transcriptional antiterminator [Breznakia sp. PFB2-8]MDF9859399.1 lichenan operon transcriptional antiterminator [Breznakia sp. PH5-24]